MYDILMPPYFTNTCRILEIHGQTPLDSEINDRANYRTISVLVTVLATREIRVYNFNFVLVFSVL